MKNAAATQATEALNAITFAEVEAAAAFFRAEGWTEHEYSLWFAVEDASEVGRGDLLRLISHYRARSAKAAA